MLRRKMGKGKSSRSMAKKTTPAALQTEISNDKEWAKVLEKKGLVVVDVYSEWSGPCTGMVSILKKIKMEIGGDALSYAIAKCDNITDLKRFQGKSEPTWMFIHDGQMVNLMFGAHCPKLIQMLTTELQRIQNEEPHEFSIPISQRSPEEESRLKIINETKIAKEAARKAQKEAEAKERYEAEMLHLTTSLNNQTCLMLYPWVFKDEEGHRRDKKSSPPYVELIEEILPTHFTVEQEIRKCLDEEILAKMFKESDYELSENNKELLLDGKCMFMRLTISKKEPEVEIHKYLMNLLYGELEIPKMEETQPESYAKHHKPAFIPSGKENFTFPLVWTPPNPRNKAIVFRTIFNKYISTNFPYEDKTMKVPIIMFKYDSTRKNDLKTVLEMFRDEVVNFGVFEYDKPPEAKMTATNIEDFEANTQEKTGYETFVCTVKRTGCEAFLSFAGIGPFHVSENSEKAVEESQLYFPVANIEETQSDDEEKIEEIEENVEEQEVATNSVSFNKELYLLLPNQQFF